MDDSFHKVKLSDLKAPLMLTWHLTNKCNFNCIHCLWNAGPDQAFPNELREKEAMEICWQIIDFQIPYVILSGGEPFLYPSFWKICEFLSQNDVDIKIESNGSLIDEEKAKKLTFFNLRSIQISIDGACQETYSKMRTGAKLGRVLNAIKELVKQGVPTEVVYVPTKFNKHEAEKIVDMAFELGVKSFYTGKTMYLGRAVENWNIIGLSEEENKELSQCLDKKAAEYENKMTVLFYPYSAVEELKYRFEHPAAGPLLMANGKVKLIGPMPFVCGDIRKQTIAEIWQRYVRAWEHPEVAKYINSVIENPFFLKKANCFVELNL